MSPRPMSVRGNSLERETQGSRSLMTERYKRIEPGRTACREEARHYCDDRHDYDGSHHSLRSLNCHRRDTGKGEQPRTQRQPRLFR